MRLVCNVAVDAATADNARPKVEKLTGPQCDATHASALAAVHIPVPVVSDTAGMPG